MYLVCLTCSYSMFVCFVVTNFSRPYLLTCNVGSTDYINAVFIDVSFFLLNILSLFLLFFIYYFARSRFAKYCDQHVCLSVCLLVCLQNHMFKFQQIFCTCCLLSWLSPPLTTVEYVVYFWFCGAVDGHPQRQVHCGL